MSMTPETMRLFDEIRLARQAALVHDQRPYRLDGGVLQLMAAQSNARRASMLIRHAPCGSVGTGVKR